jgi:hypothetical protein
MSGMSSRRDSIQHLLQTTLRTELRYEEMVLGVPRMSERDLEACRKAMVVLYQGRKNEPVTPRGETA